MRASYFVRTNGGRLLCFYYQAGSICLRERADGAWGTPEQLMAGAGENFTVNIFKNNDIHLFFQDGENSVVLAVNHGGSWKVSQPVLRPQSAGGPIFFNSIAAGTGRALIYNIPNEDKTHYLATQGTDINGRWNHYVKIDKLVPLRDEPFHVQNAGEGHAVVFYQAREPEFCLGYREITLSRAGDFVPLCGPGTQVSDCSFLTTEDSIHILYIVKGLFSTQLIYRKRHEGGLTAPQAVFEAQRMDKCLLSIAKGVLNISFTLNGWLYCLSSADGGASFSRPRKVSQTPAYGLVKAVYLSNARARGEDCFRREVYAAADSVWDILPLNEVYGDVYAEARPAAPKPRPEPRGPERVLAPAKTPDEEFFSQPFGRRGAAVSEEALPELKARLASAEKDRKERGEEFRRREDYYIARIKSLEERAAGAEAETARLRDEVESLKKRKGVSVFDFYTEGEGGEKEPVSGDSCCLS